VCAKFLSEDLKTVRKLGSDKAPRLFKDSGRSCALKIRKKLQTCEQADEFRGEERSCFAESSKEERMVEIL
jgi:hypothetical protein